jgi:hypothetical protein
MLNDSEVAAVITHIGTSWGNQTSDKRLNESLSVIKK